MVYVVQEVLGRNILPAKQFGEIEVLLPPGQIMFSPGPSVARLSQKLKSFTPDDFLLLIGDPAAIAIAAVIASEMSNGVFSMLKWDREHRQYFPIKVDIFRRLSHGGNTD